MHVGEGMIMIYYLMCIGWILCYLKMWKFQNERNLKINAFSFSVNSVKWLAAYVPIGFYFCQLYFGQIYSIAQCS